MKKILFITPFTPSNVGAGVKYTKNLIEDLSKTNQIDLMYVRTCRKDVYKEPNSRVKIIESFSINRLQKIVNALLLFWLHPLFTVKFNIFILFRIINITKKNKYDYIYFDFSQLSLYSKFIKHHHKILMIHDVVTQRYSRQSSKIISWWVEKTEKFSYNSNNISLFTFSVKDCVLLKNLFKLPSHQTNFYLENIVLNSKPSNIGDYFVFFAHWKRKDNYDMLKFFFQKVYPFLNQGHHFVIIGGGLDEQNIKDLLEYKNVRYLGFTENPYNLISNAQAIISPLFSGAGVKVKVVESFACGVPVIGTDIAFEGIDINNSNFKIIANTDKEYIQILNKFSFANLDERMSFKKNFIMNIKNKNVVNFINK